MVKRKVPDWFYANQPTTRLPQISRHFDDVSNSHQPDMRRLYQLQDALRKPDGYAVHGVTDVSTAGNDVSVQNVGGVTWLPSLQDDGSRQVTHRRNTVTGSRLTSSVDSQGTYKYLHGHAHSGSSKPMCGGQAPIYSATDRSLYFTRTSGGRPQQLTPLRGVLPSDYNDDYSLTRLRKSYAKEDSFTRLQASGSGTHFRSGRAAGPIQRPHTPTRNVFESQRSRYGDSLLQMTSSSSPVGDVKAQRGRTYSLHNQLKTMLRDDTKT